MKIGHSKKKNNIEFVNLLANDATRIEQSTLFICYLFLGPLQLAGIIVVLINYVDYTILSGVLVIFLVLPIQALINKIMQYFEYCVEDFDPEKLRLKIIFPKQTENFENNRSTYRLDQRNSQWNQNCENELLGNAIQKTNRSNQKVNFGFGG
jgi:hypothetical protein